MGKWRHLRIVLLGIASIAWVALSLNGCGASNGAAGGGGTLAIATDLPVSGTDAGVGLPTQNGVDLAVAQNANLGNGYHLRVIHKNDEGTSGADPSIGASNIQQLLSDSSVMAIVGPFNSGVAVAEIPIVNKATITEISPTNTNPGLTKEQYAAARGIIFSQLHPAGKPEAYFRIAGTDDVQGKVDAMVALNAPISAKTAFVVDDNTVYGKGLVSVFESTFTGSGGRIVGTPTSITAAQVGNLIQLASLIVNVNPDVVFYGGVTSGGGGALKKDLVAAGYNKAMVGGDGIADDPAWLTSAGSAAVNTYGTVAAPDISGLTSPTAQAFISAYKAQFPSANLLPYSASAYDAAMIEIDAIQQLIRQGKPVTRSNVRDAVGRLHYKGVTGSIYFDSNGDNAGNKVFSVYGVDPTNKWVFKQVVNV